jgi:hypothetical protein
MQDDVVIEFSGDVAGRCSIPLSTDRNMVVKTDGYHGVERYLEKSGWRFSTKAIRP